MAELTILIPTKNRNLTNLIRYYQEAHKEISFSYPIILGDSSNPPKTIEAPNITHIQNPSLEKTAGWQQDKSLLSLADRILTPYVAFFGDDDYGVLPNLDEGVRFLEEHPHYSEVCGRNLLWGDSGTRIQPTRSYEENTIEERLKQVFMDYHLLEYGIFHTAQFQKRWKRLFEVKDCYLAELLNAALIVLDGKVKKLDSLFVVRRVGSYQSSAKIGDSFEWVASKDFSFGYAKLVEILSEKVERKVVKSAIDYYILKTLNYQWRIDHKKSFKARLKQSAFYKLIKPFRNAFSQDKNFKQISQEVIYE